MGRSLRRLLRWLLFAWFVSVGVSVVAGLLSARRQVSTADPDSDEIELSGIFRSFDFVSTSTAFRGGSMVCWYGGGTLDLREATLDPAGAILTVRAIYGGARILVPEEWRVTTSIRGLAGGAGDDRDPLAQALDGPELRIEGVAFVGGVGITD
jgi:predicted membrane protein